MLLFKRIFALCLVPYAFWLVFSYDYHFIDDLNLLLHEGGHALFMFFGDWLHCLGGTLFQLFVPLAFALIFLYRRQKYESAFCGIWFGESMMSTAVYMSDAKDQLLPLVFSGGIHDWNWMFSRMGLLEHCEGIALFFHVVASIIVLTSVAYMIYSSFRKEKLLVTDMNLSTQPIQQIKEDSESKYAERETVNTNWSVWRQDDNGNVTLVKSGLTEIDALQLVSAYDGKGHKQTYWAQESQ